MRIFSFLAIALLLAEVVIGAPFVPDNTEDSQETEENVSSTTPHFLSQPLQLVVDEGHEVRLPCMLDQLEGFLLIWRKNNRIISIGDRIVHKSASKFHIEESENGNTLVIENVDETDEAHFSCCISANSETEIDHNVIVIKKDQNELEEGETATKISEATSEEIENVEQGSGLEPDAIEKSIKKESQHDKEEEEALMNEDDATTAGKIYFARVPSFYTFPDEDKKVVTEREQLIKHAPTSVIEFLRLLKIHHNSVLTKDDVEEFNEFMFQKKPIPNTHLLRGTHAYNSNLRKRLQSANIKEIENKKGLTEKVIETEDLESGLMHETDYSSDISIQEVAESEEEYVETTSNLSEEVRQDSYTESEVKEEESEVSIEEGKDEIQLSESEVSTEEVVDEEHVSESEASTEEVKDEESALENKVFTAKVKDDEDYLESGEQDEKPENYVKIDGADQEQYASGVRYLQGNNIEDSIEDEDERVSEGKSPTLRGQHILRTGLEDFDLEYEKRPKTVKDTKSREAFALFKPNEDQDDIETEPEDNKSIEREEVSMITKQSEEEYVDSKSDYYFATEEDIENEDDIEQEPYKTESIDKEEVEMTQDENKIILHDVKWYENRPAYSLTADRYLDENEIGYSKKQEDVLKEKSVPLYRGQHHPASTLEDSILETHTISHKELVDSQSDEDYTVIEQIKKEDAVEEESDNAELLESDEDYTAIEQIKKEDVVEEESNNAEMLEKNEDEELITIDEDKMIHHDVKWYENRPAYSLTADRYLDENEIGYSESEVDVQKEKLIPLYRGQHHHENTLDESLIEKVIDENESERYSESEDIRSEDVPHFEPVPKEMRQDTDLKDGVEERTYDTFGEDSEESLETKTIEEEQEALTEDLNIAELIYGDRLNANEPESESNLNGDVKSRNDQHLSHSSHRYLKGSEIGQVVEEKEILTQKMMIPVIRGQHLPVSTLEEFNVDHMTYRLKGDKESSEFENEGKLEHSESSNKFHQIHDTKKSEDIYTDERVNIEKLLQSETELENKLGDGTDKEILYPKEIMAMERRYFTKNIKEENTEEGRHPLLISNHDREEEESDEAEDYKPEEYTHEADIKEDEKYNLIGSVYHSEDEDENSEEDVEEDLVTVEYHRETDQNENAINRPLLYDQDIKIDEVAHIVTAEHLHTNDEATDKDMIPLKVLNENVNDEKDVEFESDVRNKKRKNRRDGPHPFRFICMLRKCS